MPEFIPPETTSTLKEIGLFAGIGGFSLGAQMAGIEPVFHCEINPYCQKILKQNFPNAGYWDDITTLNKEIIYEQLNRRFGTRPTEFILTGGFP